MGQLIFTFNYDAPDQSQFPVRPASNFSALIECHAPTIQKWGLWPSFVAEYRSQRRTLQEAWADTSEARKKSRFRREPPTEEELEALEELCFWGPSQPFEPAEARAWATKWIAILEVMTDAQAQSVFPLHGDLHQQDSPFGRNHEMKQLGHLIDQADCAESRGVKMTLEMCMD
jgi:hypothetical protein